MNRLAKRFAISWPFIFIPAALFADPPALTNGVLWMGVDPDSAQQAPSAQGGPKKEIFHHYSMDQMQAACQGVVSNISKVGCTVYDTPQWSDYVNHGHFVPKACDPFTAAGATNFDVQKVKDPQSGALVDMDVDSRRKIALPIAEVTETGKFILWGDVCNFYQVGPDICAAQIFATAAHEGRHFTQWQAIAKEAVENAYGMNLNQSAIPINLDQLRQRYPNAVDAFMKKWTDGRHYQCREVEVYGAQLEKGEIPKEALKDADFLKTMAFYYNGCKKNPRWAKDFDEHLKKWDQAFKSQNFTPPETPDDGCK